jgi:hypothetical protein
VAELGRVQQQPQLAIAEQRGPADGTRELGGEDVGLRGWSAGSGRRGGRTCRRCLERTAGQRLGGRDLRLPIGTHLDRSRRSRGRMVGQMSLPRLRRLDLVEERLRDLDDRIDRLGLGYG